MRIGNFTGSEFDSTNLSYLRLRGLRDGFEHEQTDQPNVALQSSERSLPCAIPLELIRIPALRALGDSQSTCALVFRYAKSQCPAVL